MIYENLQAFGPKITGANLLINRYMKREDSLLYSIEQILNQRQQRNIEESKVP